MVVIEPFDRMHLEKTFVWMQDASLRKSFLFNRSVTSEAHLAWFERIKTSTTEKIYAVLCEQIHVGNLGLKNIELSDHRAETWIYVGDESVRGKGVASQAYNELFDLLRRENKINYLYCHIASFNLSSIRLYRQLGFVQDFSFSKKQKWDDEEYDLLRLNKEL